MQEIKLLTLDIDGTLIKDAGSDIAEVDRDAIARAQAAGVKVTLSTGRLFNVARRFQLGLSIKEPLITINGADVRDEQRSYFMDEMPLRDVEEVITAYADTDIGRYISAENMIYYTKKDIFPRLRARWDFGYMGECPVGILDSDDELMEALKGLKIQKILLWVRREEDLPTLTERVRPFERKFAVVRGDRHNLELNCKETSKGSGLRRLAKHYGFGLENTMAIGDGGNDVDILKTAGVGVAMGNAMSEAIDAADYVTADVEHGGVAQAIDKFIFGK